MVNLFKKSNKGERHEEVSLEITVDKIPPEFSELMDDTKIKIKKGDTATLTYNFNIGYYDGIAKRFELLTKLMRSGNVRYIDGDLRPLNQEVCLIKDFIETLQNGKSLRTK